MTGTPPPHRPGGTGVDAAAALEVVLVVPVAVFDVTVEVVAGKVRVDVDTLGQRQPVTSYPVWIL
jgi:hypothetical protein